MSLDATPKSPTANSFLTTDRMAELLALRANVPATWPTTLPEQERLLATATRLLAMSFEWDGVVRELLQALPWPRAGATDADGRWLDYDVIPLLIEEATAELALHLSDTRNPLKVPDVLGIGIGELTAGPVRIKVDKTQLLSFIPDIVILMLRPVGRPVGGATASGSGSVILRRV